MNMLSIQAHQTSIFDFKNRLLSQNPEESHQSTERTTAANLSIEKNIDISIMTAEGDRVTLSAKSEASGDFSTYSSTGFLSSLENSSLSLSISREISLLVEGDLSAEEMEDIEDLLHKIDSIAKKLFKGDIDKAISKALNIGDFDTIESLEAHLQFETSSSVFVQHSGMTEAPVVQSSSEEGDSPETTDLTHSYLKSLENKGSLTIAHDGTSKNVSAQTEFEETTTTKENAVTVNLVELARSYEFTSSLMIEPPEAPEPLTEPEESEESSISSLIKAEPEEEGKVSKPVPESSEEVTLLEPVSANDEPEIRVTQEIPEETESSAYTSAAEDTETTPVQTLSYEKTVNVTIEASVTTTAQTQPSEEPITMSRLKEAFKAMAKEVDGFGRKGRRPGLRLGRLMNHHFNQMSRSHHRHGAKMQLFQMMKNALMEQIQQMVQFEISVQLSSSSTQQGDNSQTGSSSPTDHTHTDSTQQNGGSEPVPTQSDIPQLSEEEIDTITSTTALYEGYSTAQYRMHSITTSEAGTGDSADNATPPEEESLEVIA